MIDADTGRPIANATVGIWNDRWGFRNGQLVWDKSYLTQASTNASGKFRLSVAGGSNLTVVASGYPKIVTSACASPMLIRVGGSYWNDAIGRFASVGFDAAGERVGWSFADGGKNVPAGEADLLLEGPVPDLNSNTVTLQAPLGMLFVSGTGNPRSAPKAGFSKRLEFNLGACGWLFVQTPFGSVAVSPQGVSEFNTDGSRMVVFPYRKLALNPLRVGT